MKLVIDIHEKDYQSILNSGQVPYGVVCAIMNGTPLPKGHGRLGDLDELEREMYHKAFETDTDLQKWDSGCWIRYKMFEIAAATASTIIEADKEASDD